MYITKNKTLIWRTPDSVVNHSPLPMLVLTILLLVIYAIFIVICRKRGTFHSISTVHSLSVCTRSKGVHDPYVVHIAQMQHSLSFVISAADIS